MLVCLYVTQTIFLSVSVSVCVRARHGDGEIERLCESNHISVVPASHICLLTTIDNMTSNILNNFPVRCMLWVQAEHVASA